MHNVKNKGGAKAKNFKEALKVLFKNLSEYKILIIIACVLACVGTIFTVIGPNQLTKITDEITYNIMGKIDTDYVLKIAITLFVLYISAFLFSFLQNFLMAIVTQKYAKKLRSQIADKLNKLPLSYFDKNKVGDILSRVSNDVDTISSSLNQSISSLLSAIVTLFGVIIMMLYTNVTMTITAIISSLVGFLIMAFILKNSQKYFNLQQQELGVINGHVEEIYSSFEIVKAYNGVQDAKTDFDKYNKALYHNSRMSQFLSGLMPPLMGFIGNLSYVSVTVMGAYLVSEDIISFGVIVAYMIYIRLFTNPLSQIAQGINSLQLVSAASERVYEFLDEEEVSHEKARNKLNPKTTKGHIEFNNVSFGYKEDKLIIKNFTSNVLPGQKIAIVGPTGAGKTTLVNLLMRFYEINEGFISIDDVKITDLSRDNVHSLFCMVLQDTWLYEDTIEANVRFNANNVSRKEVEKVCKIVGIDHLIRTLPQGYDTILSDADSLSAGEKQLLTIARGMLKHSPFLILDEATSNIDTRTEILVQKAMDKLMEGKTSFIIAHRLSTIKNADKILVLKDGNILEQGSHNELMKLNGFYSELYNSQFEK